jgi:hypothetical protein
MNKFEIEAFFVSTPGFNFAHIWLACRGETAVEQGTCDDTAAVVQAMRILILYPMNFGPGGYSLMRTSQVIAN